jgi:hypothetical protein
LTRTQSHPNHVVQTPVPLRFALWRNKTKINCRTTNNKINCQTTTTGDTRNKITHFNIFFNAGAGPSALELPAEACEGPLLLSEETF